ncbi:MAG TPA: PQQ-dependent catabolism-associated CXXCW motif protein [Acetobacteraceae bacterium]|nr:PQQ-dependent catabolism-associated CXXCW motif protein [Acetobacteraceae bacterium]
MRLVALLFGAAMLLAAAPPEPAGYRMDDYRAAVPDTLAGGTVLSTEAARALWQGRDAVFIDVLPQAPRPAGLPAGTIWRDKPRADIPGSIWLPDTGYGELAPVMQQYFERGLEQASGGDRNRMLVFYCLASCWMSWNAAKRALEIGYRNVAWYPEGTDGWAAADLPLEVRAPVPRPGAAE